MPIKYHNECVACKNQNFQHTKLIRDAAETLRYAFFCCCCSMSLHFERQIVLAVAPFHQKSLATEYTLKIDVSLACRRHTAQPISSFFFRRCSERFFQLFVQHNRSDKFYLLAVKGPQLGAILILRTPNVPHTDISSESMVIFTQLPLFQTIRTLSCRFRHIPHALDCFAIGTKLEMFVLCVLNVSTERAYTSYCEHFFGNNLIFCFFLSFSQYTPNAKSNWRKWNKAIYVYVRFRIYMRLKNHNSFYFYIRQVA